MATRFPRRQYRVKTTGTSNMSGECKTISSFHGGLHLEGHKAISTRIGIQSAGIPGQLILPVIQHKGSAGEILVAVGDAVNKGQRLTRCRKADELPVHASTSGTILSIQDLPVPHLSPDPSLCIVIKTDGKDSWGDPQHNSRMSPMLDYQNAPKEVLLKRIRKAGIAGLGGASFPTERKLSTELNIDTLIINAVECEPYITCDDMLMREHSKDIISGIEILMAITSAHHCLIGIEANKPEAIASIKQQVKKLGRPHISVCEVPTIYPSGGEKQLIKLLTDKEVPSGKHPANIGIICHNVGTAKAIHDAVIEGKPLIERIVTVTGYGIQARGNYRALIGTRVIDLINETGGYSYDMTTLMMGGSVMGIPIQYDTVPVVKATNCLLSLHGEQNIGSHQQEPCIRCGECVKVCPAVLLPQQLYWHAKAKDTDKLNAENLFDCIECGCCNIVCPSHIPLVDYYRYAKNMIRNETDQKQRSDRARQRHEFRQLRLETKEQQRQQRLAEKKKRLKNRTKAGTASGKQKEIQAALDRVKIKKDQANIKAKKTETGDNK